LWPVVLIENIVDDEPTPSTKSPGVCEVRVKSVEPIFEIERNGDDYWIISGDDSRWWNDSTMCINGREVKSHEGKISKEFYEKYTAVSRFLGIPHPDEELFKDPDGRFKLTDGDHITVVRNSRKNQDAGREYT
jgi:hypothetical protein